MKNIKNKVLSIFMFALFITSCMFVVTACGKEHKAAENWTTDETYHWHVCTVEDCNDEEHIFDKAEHDFELVITEDSTCTSLGKQHMECKVCGYKTADEEIALKNHTYNNSKNNGKVCTVCGYINGEATIGTGDAMVVYDSLASAVSSAKDGDTIVLTKDVNLVDNYLTFDKKITLNLNGKTLTGNGAHGVLYVVKNGDLTVTGNGKVVAVAGNDTTVGVTTGTVWAMAVWACGGKVTIENGTFTNQLVEGQNISTQTSENLDLIYAKDDADGNISEIVIKDGIFNGIQKEWTLNIHNTSKSSITVYGGTFIGYDPVVGDNGNAENKTFIAPNYKSKQIDTTGNYVVVPEAIQE